MIEEAYQREIKPFDQWEDSLNKLQMLVVNCDNVDDLAKSSSWSEIRKVRGEFGNQVKMRMEGKTQQDAMRFTLDVIGQANQISALSHYLVADTLITLYKKFPVMNTRDLYADKVIELKGLIDQ